MITVVARVIRDEFSGKEGAKVWSVKSINRPYKEVESCDKRRRRQRMDLTRSQRNALFAFFERVNNSSSIFPSRHVHVYIFWKIEDWKCSSGMKRDSNFLSQNVDREKYIYLFGKKDWKIEREKIGLERRTIEGGEFAWEFPFVWEKNLLGKIGRMSEAFPPRGRLPVGNDRCRERLAIVRPEREVEEEGSGRGNLGRNKAVITLVPQLTGQLIKSRGLLIPASLSLYFSTNLDKAGYSPTVLIIFNSSRLGNVR